MQHLTPILITIICFQAIIIWINHRHINDPMYIEKQYPKAYHQRQREEAMALAIHNARIALDEAQENAKKEYKSNRFTRQSIAKTPPLSPNIEHAPTPHK